MTIAAGFACPDGVVLGCDSEHTGAGVKVSRAKMFSAGDEQWALAITGAGDSAYLEFAIQQITEVVRDGMSVDRARAAITRVVSDIHVNHIYKVPIVQAADRPTVSLLVAVKAKNDVVLFQSHETTITTVKHHACLGFGTDLGEYLTDTYFLKRLGVHYAAVVATYLLHQAKMYVPYCGGRSQVLLIPKEGAPRELATNEIIDFEALFSHVGRKVTFMLFASCTAPDEEFERQTLTDAIVSYLRLLRKLRGASSRAMVAEARAVLDAEEGGWGLIDTAAGPIKIRKDEE